MIEDILESLATKKHKIKKLHLILKTVSPYKLAVKHILENNKTGIASCLTWKKKEYLYLGYIDNINYKEIKYVDRIYNSRAYFTDLNTLLRSLNEYLQK